MNIGNPIISLPRYAKLFSAGIQGKRMPIPPGNGKIDNTIYNLSSYANQHPYITLGANIGGMVTNNMLGNPIGSLIDTVTFGTTDFDRQNFRPTQPGMTEVNMMPPLRSPRDAYGNTITPGYSAMGIQPSYFPEQQQYFNIPQLDEAERKKQVEYLQRKTATDLITIQALQQQPGMENY